MPSNHLILCCPLLFLPSIFLSIRVFSNESALCIRWPQYWSLSFSISPSNEHPGLISFRMDWLYLLAVWGTLKSLLHHSSKASLLCSAFFMVQLSHPYIYTVQWLGLGVFTGVAQLHFLVRELRSHKLCGKEKKNFFLNLEWCTLVQCQYCAINTFFSFFQSIIQGMPGECNVRSGGRTEPAVRLERPKSNLTCLIRKGPIS